MILALKRCGKPRLHISEVVEQFLQELLSDRMWVKRFYLITLIIAYV